MATDKPPAPDLDLTLPAPVFPNEDVTRVMPAGGKATGAPPSALYPDDPDQITRIMPVAPPKAAPVPEPMGNLGVHLDLDLDGGGPPAPYEKTTVLPPTSVPARTPAPVPAPALAPAPVPTSEAVPAAPVPPAQRATPPEPATPPAPHATPVAAAAPATPVAAATPAAPVVPPVPPVSPSSPAAKADPHPQPAPGQTPRAPQAATAAAAPDARTGTGTPGPAPALPVQRPPPVASCNAATAAAPTSHVPAPGVPAAPDATPAAARPTAAIPVAKAQPSPAAQPSPTAAPHPAPPPRAPRTPEPDTLFTAGTASSLPGQGSDGTSSTSTGDHAVRQVGRYEIRSRLGRGGMATVYRAHDPKIGRDVAIKFLHASLSEDAECRTRFLREARAAGGLSHPNIVIVHDVGELENRPYMAMELLEGESLAEILDKKRVLPIREVVSVGLQLARALEYAHARGIVHRDIKPANVMLLSDGSSVKVTDFGIAHMEEAGMQQQTVVGAVMGTPQYMSPEQTRGEKIDGRSDLFSTGILLYQAITGERPFKGDNMVAVAQAIASAEPPAIAGRRSETPPALRRIVERCLAKNPAQRYASGKELAAALRKVQVELEATEAEKARPRIVPLRLKWALLMATVVAVVMGVTTFVINQRQYAALMAQASEYGAALTRFIAKQNAAAVLGEEWDVVDIAVQETMRTRNFERIVVIDKAGQVRVSTVHGMAGLPYETPAGESLGTLAGGVAASRYQTNSGTVLGFEAPVMFRDQQVGRVALGVPEEPLSEVARLSHTLMAVLVMITVAAVGLATFFLVNWFARPVQLVVDSLGELVQGHYGYRIGEQRKDEFGELYAAVDRLAQTLQRREEADTGTSPPTRVPGTLPPQDPAQPPGDPKPPD